nr:hypothetical protein [Chitinophagaceae bacterium]
SASAFVQHLRPDWINKDGSFQKNRLEVTDIKWNENVHTPWINRLTRHIDHSMFAWSHLLQPDLFIRIRPGKKEKVINALEGKQIRWKDEQYDCIRLPVQTKLDEILTLNRDAVVQDLSSSQCGLVIKECIPKIEGWVWDVCAASGGKSILLNDLYPGKIKLIVSDIRPSILSNLQKRFLEAGVNAGYHFVADHLSITHPKRALPPVEVLLIDAPCTGSGTWARTPEQHYFFKDSCIQDYADKQFNICLNVFDQLKANGFLIYITCSVFEDENEKVVEKLLSQKPLRLVHSQYIDGTQRRSDSMFIAILQKD